MRHFNLKTGTLFALSLALTACGQPGQQLEETCSQDKCSEKTINAPVSPDPVTPPAPQPPSPPALSPAPTAYRFPDFDPKWDLGRGTYEKMERYHAANAEKIGNPRYVTIIDFSQPMSHHRLYLFDLKHGTVERHATSHGKNSDRDNDGFATEFSNTPDSLQSSLGFYLTLATYNGSHGYSLRLRGLEKTNDKAEERAIVMHPADYVSDAKNYAGRSWGCPAVDPKISKKLIDRVKNGSLILIAYDQNEARRWRNR